MNKAFYSVIGIAALGLVGAAAWWWRHGSSHGPDVTASATPEVRAASAPALPASAASAPGIRYPIEAPVAAVADQAPPVPPSVDEMLMGLFGRKAVQSLFQLPDFPRRFAATVDNLGRSQAPAIIWPLNPAEGRFSIRTQDGASIIEPDNGLRYTAHVLLLETVDMKQAAATYAALYPAFQQAYEDLGFPKKYFNDRLVDVIDQLLATPEVDGPLKVHLQAVQGPVQPARPWVLYEFDDARLNALTSGQRILLRMGPVNERRVKARLAEFRRLVTATPPPR